MSDRRDDEGFGAGYVAGALNNYYRQGVVHIPGFLPRAAFVDCCTNKRPKFHVVTSEKEFDANPDEIAMADLDSIQEARFDVQMPGTAALRFRTTFNGCRERWRWAVGGIVAGSATIEGAQLDGGGQCGIQIRGTANIVNNSDKTIPDRCLIIAHEPPKGTEEREHAIIGVPNRKLMPVLHPFINGSIGSIFGQLAVYARLQFADTRTHGVLNNLAKATSLAAAMSRYVRAENMRLREEHYQFDPIEYAAKLLAVEHVYLQADGANQTLIDTFLADQVAPDDLPGAARAFLPGATAQIESMVNPGERVDAEGKHFRDAFDPAQMSFGELHHWMRDLAAAIYEQRLIGKAIGTAFPGQTVHVMLIPRAAT